MKVAVVTGANRGIGFEAARQLAAQDFKVLVTARDFVRAQNAANQIQGDVMPVQLDVSSQESCDAFAEYINGKIDYIDVLVNNAGIMGSASMLRFEMEEIEQVMNTNFLGPLRITKTLMPYLNKSDDGRIINVSSGMGARDELIGGYAAYRFSKYALNGFSIMLENELENQKIKVFSMCPGWCATDMGGEGAPRSPEKGAETITYLATSNEVESGKFYRDEKVIPW